ncbi:MAG: glutamine--fructose-6-phosphate transaminase (isomerizing) [Candidatus Diapherotrites archaeon]
MVSFVDFTIMCGISGVVGKDAVKKTFEGLKFLEYRGYDSWGLAFESNNSLFVEKHVGKIGEANITDFESQKVAIGHTRWATHGNVTKQNAHPHISNDGKIAIVHNGIVENFSALKEKLSKNGFVFYSQTDSEIIANLIQYNVANSKDFLFGFAKSMREIEGNYAVVAMKLGEKKLYCARFGSPLVLGISEDSFFVGSDATSFISYTKKAVFLEDNQIAVIGDDIKIFDTKTLKELKYHVKVLNWSVEQAKKGNFAHFMLKEILEQPITIKNSLEQPPDLIEKISKRIKSAKKIFLVGCGSSYHACLVGSYFFSSISSIETKPVLASEFYEQLNFSNADSLVIAISQSGETADLIEAVKFAKSKGSKLVAIVNVMDSTLMRLADNSILMNCGPEICVLSTKSYTSQLAILLYLSYFCAGKKDEGKKIILDCAKEIGDFLSEKNISSLRKLVEKPVLSSTKDIFVIGRSIAYPTALESALKIKEVSYVHAEGFAGGELKHGTIALVNQGTPVISLFTPETDKLILSNTIEMKSRGAYVIGISSFSNNYFDHWIEVKDCGNANPIMLIVPIQLISYFLALTKNLDPDKPRNLAKSVTVK